MESDFHSAGHSFSLPEDDNEIFEAILQEDSSKTASAVYNVLDKIQAPFRERLINWLEEVDEKYGENISDEQIEKIDALLFNEKGQEKFITAQGFEDIAAFVKNKNHALSDKDIAVFDNLNMAYRSKVKNFLNATLDINNETPLIYACVWGALEAAEILKQEGADIPNNLLQKTIQWSDMQTVDWVLHNNVQITLQDIAAAKQCAKDDIAKHLECLYKQKHSDYVADTDMQTETKTEKIITNRPTEARKSRFVKLKNMRRER